MDTLIPPSMIFGLGSVRTLGSWSGCDLVPDIRSPRWRIRLSSSLV